MAVAVTAAAAAGCGPPANPGASEGSGGGRGSGTDGVDAAPDLCGNGVLDPGETCDPPSICVVECDDQDPCTVDTVGSAATCDLRCRHTDVAVCVGGDACCPHGCSQANDADCSPFTLAPDYAEDYWLVDLGPPPGLPVRFGALTIAREDPYTLLIGGDANREGGAIYSVPLRRNPNGHITGFAGPARRAFEAAWNDGGIAYAPDGVLLLARWPKNELGQTKPGSVVTDKIVDLAPLMVTPSPGGLCFVPSGFPGAGQLKLVSWAGGEWYTLAIAPDGNGTWDVTGVTPHPAAKLSGGPTGMAYVPMGSPKFDAPSVLVSEWSEGAVATYEVDANGDPIPTTRRDFIPGLPGAIGAAIDPLTGDYLFSTFVFAGGDRVVVVRGFATPIE